MMIGGVTQLVFDNARAAEILLTAWPVRHGWHHRKAQEAVHQSMRSPHDAALLDRARETFSAAAREAGALLGGGAPDAGLRVGYHLVSGEGDETFTTRKELADVLAADGWMIVSYLGLPIVPTDAMILAGESELSRILGTSNLPDDGVRRLLTAALAPLNQKQFLR